MGNYGVIGLMVMNNERIALDRVNQQCRCYEEHLELERIMNNKVLETGAILRELNCLKWDKRQM